MPAALRDLYRRSVSQEPPSSSSSTSPPSVAPMDLTRYSLPALRQYDLAQQITNNQGALNKLLGKIFDILNIK